MTDEGCGKVKSKMCIRCRGRPNVRFLYEDNKPVKHVFIHLGDVRSDGKFIPCVWGKTDDNGVLQKLSPYYKYSRIPKSWGRTYPRQIPVKMRLVRNYTRLRKLDIKHIHPQDTELVNVDSVTSLPRRLPSIELRFLVFSSARVATMNVKFMRRRDWMDSMEKFVKSLVYQARQVWRPESSLNKNPNECFRTTLEWNGNLTVIEDTKDWNGGWTHRRINFPLDEKYEEAREIVRNNFSNPDFNRIIPVFVAHVGWWEQYGDKGPRDTPLRGCCVRGPPSERAIFILSSRSTPFTLAHELSHWFGVGHQQAKKEGPPQNIGISDEEVGPIAGLMVNRTQLSNMYKWATIRNVRMHQRTR